MEHPSRSSASQVIFTLLAAATLVGSPAAGRLAIGQQPSPQQAAPPKAAATQRAAQAAATQAAATQRATQRAAPPKAATAQATGDDWLLHTFERQQLTDVYYSEGIAAGDINGDGIDDVVHGPYWFAGPKFTSAREIYPPKAQPREAYADNFFSWIHDFDGDGANDVLVVGFPGTPALVYQNPGAAGLAGHWKKHQVLDWVSNESPQFVQLVGDSRPELVCTRDGKFGYAGFEPGKGLQPWVFHPISDAVAPKRFGHGLGVGDVNGDQRLDVLAKNGWFEQPEENDGRLWQFHAANFAERGGAEMHVYDVDGDGDNDVITSLAAHEFGLAWYEQLPADGSPRFRKHLIMGAHPEENPYGLAFSELHSVALADIDGDGLRDIVTGKTYWSHHRQSPQWDAGAVVYWFRLVRSAEGVQWVPHRADDRAGIGRQLLVHDLNRDGHPELLSGGMKGAHVLHHLARKVTAPQWQAAQPRPRVAMAEGLGGEEAAQRMTVPEGFQVSLAAAEPLVHQPIAFTIDGRGRLWVAEAYTYPVRAPEGQGKDKIIILEDTTGDGRLDQRKVFAEGLNLVSGLEVGFGGVWVGAAPYLMFLPDHDADDRPDGPPEILLDGFGYQDTHETLNGFIWGPDGWLYGCHGVFTHSRVGRPGTPDEQRTPLNAGIWRYHPQGRQFEVFAWGTSNPWGVDFDDHGQAFATACVIPHLWHVIQGARYQRQAGQHFNPYVFDDIKTIADHAHYTGNIRDHAWWGHEPHLPSGTDLAGGGHAHCGAMVYLGDNWPAEYRNGIFMNNIHGNRVNFDRLAVKGSGFVGSHGPDLLRANDRWFRGINLKYGPDGAVYLIDWYDRNACHRRTPEIWDRTNGRIYRIKYAPPGGAARVTASGGQRDTMNLAELAEPALVALHTHANDWHVRTARRVLQHRAQHRELARATTAALRELLADGQPLRVRLRALWTLHATHSITDNELSPLLDDSAELIRCWAIQLALEDRRAEPALVRKLAQLAASDPSQRVRLYLASALQRLPLADRWDIAAGLLGHAVDQQDHNLPLMYWYGLEPLLEADPARGLQLAEAGQLPLLKDYAARRAAATDNGLEAVVQRAGAATDATEQLRYLDAMLAAFEGRADIPAPKAWTPAYQALRTSTAEAVRDRADQIAVIFGDRRVFPQLRALLLDESAALEKRRSALQVLLRGEDPEAGAALRKLLGHPQLRAAAIRALARWDEAETPAAILKVYPQLTAGERQDAVATLAARPGSAHQLLDAVEAGTVPRTDLHAYHVRQLTSFNNQQLTSRLRKVWGEFRQSSGDKLKQIQQLKRQFAPDVVAQGKPGHGRWVFAKTCATCHTLFGAGEKVGPDLTGSNRANLDYLLENLIDPSAVLGRDYQMTIVATDDGRVLSGMVLKESASAITLRTINETLVIPKRAIETRKRSPLSMMPERLLEQLTFEQQRDLFAYLASPGQVPLRGASPKFDSQGRVPGALEGEALKVLSQTGGSTANQPMAQFRGDRWSGNAQLWWTGGKPGDRLTLELPVNQAGNYRLDVILTRARDYGMVELSVNDTKLPPPVDLYHPEVVTTGQLTFPPLTLAAGKHQLTIEITGANPSAVKSFMFGLDCVVLQPLDKQAAGDAVGEAAVPPPATAKGTQP